jgi:hypothetical protein
VCKETKGKMYQKQEDKERSDNCPCTAGCMSAVGNEVASLRLVLEVLGVSLSLSVENLFKFDYVLKL